MSQAEADYRSENYDEALTNYLNAEAIHRSAGQENSENLAVLYYKIGNCYESLTEYNLAMENFKKSLSIADRINSEEVMLDNYVHILRLYKVVGDDAIFMEEASQYEEPAERLAIKVYGNPSKELGLVYASLGDLYQRAEEHDKAVENFQKASDIIIGLFGEDSLEYADICIKLAGFYAKQKEYDKQLDILSKAIEILERTGNELSLAEAYGELGGVYSRRKHEYSKAIEYFDKSLELLDKNGSFSFLTAKYHYWKAGACYNIGEYEEFLDENIKAYHTCNQLIETELITTLKGHIKDDMKVYYDLNYEGAKAAGFDAWLNGLLNRTQGG